MSRRTKNKPRKNVVVEMDDDTEEEEEEEDYTLTQSQGACQLSEKDVKKLAGQVCNMLLAAEIRKIPLKSSDIRKGITSLKSRSSYKTVMIKAGEMMEHLFGYKIMSVKTHGYILVNTVGSTFAKYEQLPRSEEVKRGLLIAILAAIFMNEGKMSVGGLESFLNALDNDLGSSSKNMIQEFLRQKYLESTVNDLTEPPTTMYTWGDRANAEFCKKKVLEFVCEVYGNMKPSMWTYQWKLVNEENDGKESSS